MREDSKTAWRRYVLELCVVFFGVTAAFLLNSWRDNRQAASLEQDYLQNIQADLQKDRESLQENIDLLAEQKRMLGKFLAGQNGGSWTTDSTSTVVANSLTLSSFGGKSTTYESLKFSGHLSYIKNFDLRNRIVDYYESFSEIQKVEELLYFWVTQNLTPFYIVHFDMMRFRFTDDSMLDDVTFKNRMFGLRVLLQQNLTAYRDLLAANKTLLENLNQNET